MRQGKARKPQPAAPAAGRRRFVPIAVLAIVGLITYWNGLSGPFVWDDDVAIVTNQTIRQIWPPWGPLLPPLETPVSGRPIVNLSFAINYAAGGLNPTGYHFTNLCIHVACALLVFGIVRRTMLARPSPGGAVWSGDSLALVAALVWMVHPLQSEEVDYVTQRTESLMGLFFFLTLYAAIRARRSKWPTRWHVVAILSCALGTATKESMATAPIVVLLYDRVFEFDSIREAVRTRRFLYLGLAATWIELGVLMWRWPRSTVGPAASNPWNYLLNQSQMITRYLRLSVWPRALVLDYGLPRTVTVREVAPAALLVAGMVAVTLVALARWPAIGFLGAVFFVTLAPSSSVIPVASEVGAERRMYLPSAALAVLVVVLGQLAMDRVIARWADRRRAVAGVAAAAAALAIAALAVRTVYRNADYRSPLSLWQTVVERRPQGRARFAFAAELISAGRHDEAMSELREAVRDYPDARAALGTELLFEGHVDEAVKELQNFIEAGPSKPNRIPARVLLGRAFITQGRLDEASRQLHVVLDADPSNLVARQTLADLGIAHRSLAETLLRKQDAQQAAVHAREAVGIDPRDAQAHNLLGVALATQGKLDEAIIQFREALKHKPDDPQSRNNLARALDLLRTRR